MASVKVDKRTQVKAKFNFLAPWHPYEEDFQRIVQADYPGAGTEANPFVIDFLKADAEDPQLMPEVLKWILTALVAIVALAVTFCSSEYTADEGLIMSTFGASQEVVTLGVSLYVMGFALGPCLWGPLSEVIGRRPVFLISYLALTAFNIGCAAAPNIGGLLAMRFFAGAFGSSSLTNSGGTIADIFRAEKRGIAMSLFAAAPLMGPVIGPIVGGFVGMTVGWRFVFWTMVFFTGAMVVLGGLLLPETYGPVILRKRALRLSAATGKVYRSKYEDSEGGQFLQLLRESLVRPWVLLFHEPIVALLCLYMSIVYGILYLLFGAFPIVYQAGRGWSSGFGGLAFIGIAVGVVAAVLYSALDNARYVRISDAHGGRAPPEARLPPGIVGGVALPVGLFWFAWTNGRHVHWVVSIVASAPFGFGMVLCFLSCTNYLVDCYLVHAASVLAAKTLTRSSFGAIFPLFTAQMYRKIGIHWASMVPGFLALACLPFPIVLWRCGAAIRKRGRNAGGEARGAEKAGEAAAPSGSVTGSSVTSVTAEEAV